MGRGDQPHANDSDSHATSEAAEVKLDQVSVTNDRRINSNQTVKYSNSERSQQAGQFVFANTSLRPSNPGLRQSGGTLVDLPTIFINHLSSTEKIREPENPDNQQTEMISKLTTEKPDGVGSSVILSTNTEQTTSIVTSLTPFNLFNSHFFKVTNNDIKMSESTAEPPTDGSFQYEVVTSNNKQHPQLYAEDMTEVIIIRKCSTSLFRQRRRSIDFIAGWGWLMVISLRSLNLLTSEKPDV